MLFTPTATCRPRSPWTTAACGFGTRWKADRLTNRAAIDHPVRGKGFGGRRCPHRQRELGRIYAPDRMVFSIPADLPGLDAAIADKKPGDTTRAYLCRGSTCSAPVESLADLVRIAQARV